MRRIQFICICLLLIIWPAGVNAGEKKEPDVPTTVNVRFSKDYKTEVGEKSDEFLKECCSALDPVTCVAGPVVKGLTVVGIKGATSEVSTAIKKLADTGLKLKTFGDWGKGALYVTADIDVSFGKDFTKVIGDASTKFLKECGEKLSPLKCTAVKKGAADGKTLVTLQGSTTELDRFGISVAKTGLKTATFDMGPGTVVQPPKRTVEFAQDFDKVVGTNLHKFLTSCSTALAPVKCLEVRKGKLSIEVVIGAPTETLDTTFKKLAETGLTVKDFGDLGKAVLVPFQQHVLFKKDYKTMIENTQKQADFLKECTTAVAPLKCVDVTDEEKDSLHVTISGPEDKVETFGKKLESSGLDLATFGSLGTGTVKRLLEKREVSWDLDYKTVISSDEKKKTFLKECGEMMKPLKCVDVRSGSIVLTLEGKLADMNAGLHKLSTDGLKMISFDPFKAATILPKVATTAPPVRPMPETPEITDEPQKGSNARPGKGENGEESNMTEEERKKLEEKKAAEQKKADEARDAILKDDEKNDGAKTISKGRDTSNFVSLDDYRKNDTNCHNITSIDHKTGKTGYYFNWNSTKGFQDGSVTAYQYRAGKLVCSAKVKLFSFREGGSTGNAHGRKEEDPQDEDWKVDDQWCWEKLAEKVVEVVNKTNTTNTTTTTLAPPPDGWGYPAMNSEWGGLCEDGDSQSPVNLPKPSAAQKQYPLSDYMQYRDVSVIGGDTGHALEWKAKKGEPAMGYITIDDAQFLLEYITMHSGSEHRTDGKQYDIELQLYHKSEGGKWLVVAVLCSVMPLAQESDIFDSLRESMSTPTVINPMSLFQEKYLDTSRYFQYRGSFTTPPCAQEVSWIVLASTVGVPHDFYKYISGFKSMQENFRPPQELKQREITVKSLIFSGTWHYPARNDEWGGICLEGKEQSPVDFGLAVMTSMQKQSKLLDRLNYVARDFTAKDTGHGIKWASDQDMGSVTMYNKDWDLKSFNIHAKSEHTIAGGQYDLELQFVHTSADGSILIIGVLCMAENFGSNEFFESLQKSLTTAGQPDDAGVQLDLRSAVFEKIDTTRYFKYSGSLTTPPCTEGVQWVVFASELNVPKDFLIWLKRFKSMKYNFRPTQPLNDRNVETVEIAELLDDWQLTIPELIQYISGAGILIIGAIFLADMICRTRDPMRKSLLSSPPIREKETLLTRDLP